MTEPISSGCSAIDELLGDGFERGTVTQVYGPPAAGKTNLALGTAVDQAARGNSSLFIDTEGISIDRLDQLLRAQLDAGPPGEDAPDRDALAERIVVSEAHTFEEQEEAVRDAAELASQVDVIALDSATGFYRLERTEQEEGEALRAVARQLTHLLSLARKYDLAVVITNQVFSDPDGDRPRPLGGHTLTHWSGTVLRLERFRGGNRRLTLEKHRAKAAGESVRLRITDRGFEAVDETSR